MTTCTLPSPCDRVFDGGDLAFRDLTSLRMLPDYLQLAV